MAEGSRDHSGSGPIMSVLIPFVRTLPSLPIAPKDPTSKHHHSEEEVSTYESRGDSSVQSIHIEYSLLGCNVPATKQSFCFPITDETGITRYVLI